MKLSKLYKIALIVLACSTAIVSSAWASAATLAIVPFQINAEKDYTFLQQGIVEMLTSRLSSETMTVLDAKTTADAVSGIKGMSGDSLALMAAAKLKADYVIHGSLTVLGESVSIDAKMLNVTGTQPPLHFFKQTPSMNEVIPQINLLATEINDKVFGRRAPVIAAGKPQPPSARQDLPPTDSRAHPEKLLQGTITQDASGVAAPAQGNPVNSSFVTAAGTGAQGSDFWKSRSFAYIINGIDVGDVNGDGLNETVVVTPDKVHIYQFSQGRHQKMKTIDSGRFVYNVSVDVGDINANGRPEIFITRLNNQRNALSSQVLEFDGQEYKPLVSKARWYFRIIDHPVRGRLLVGQRQKAGGPDPLSSEIVFMAWNGTEYLPEGRALPPNRANALGFTVGDILDNEETMIGFTADDQLRLMTPNGKETWRSSSLYGGSMVTFNLPVEQPGDIENPIFLPVRIRTADLDRNNQTEVLVANNFGKSKKLLKRRRSFKNGQIEALKWDGLGLTPAWRTRKISGRIQDFIVADFNNDGQDDLLAAVVSKEGSLVGTRPKSSLIAYQLNK